MLASALRQADEMLSAVESAASLAYGENWLHAPPIQKARRLMLASKGVILEMRAQEGHSGSHAEYAKAWKRAGGGSLVRLGSHPLGGGSSRRRARPERPADPGQAVSPRSPTCPGAAAERAATGWCQAGRT
jgi:hypothetical protein